MKPYQSALNLPTPIGFQGLRDDLPLRIYRRHLPHWRQDGATYFVSFHFVDAVPARSKRELTRFRERLASARLKGSQEREIESALRELQKALERILDRGYGKSWLGEPVNASSLASILLEMHEKTCDLGCFTIMPNHCHLVLRPLANAKLETILGSIKSKSVAELNQRTTRRGKLWEQESYDRIVRDVDHLGEVVRYVGNNPRKAGISRDRWFRWLNPKWIDLGWSFFDP